MVLFSSCIFCLLTLFFFFLYEKKIEIINLYVKVYGFEVYCGERCGRSVAIALADMHECESNNSLKKLKGQRQSGNVKSQNIEDQPRSASRFFMYYIAHYIASYIGSDS